MILPAFGIISQVIPAFSRKPLFGYASMVYATASIAILSFIVWAHHMFTVGMPVTGQLFFMYATMLIAVPTGVKVFNWIATMWKGSMTLRDADAVRGRLPLPVHDRRLHRPDAGDRAGRHPAAGHLLRGRALPLRAGGRRAVRASSPASTTGCRSGPASMYNETLGKMPLLAVADLLQHDRSSRSTSSAWPACRAASPTTRCSSPTGTRSRRSARSASACRSCSSSTIVFSTHAAAASRRRRSRGKAPTRSSGRTAVAGAVPHLRDAARH